MEKNLEDMSADQLKELLSTEAEGISEGNEEAPPEPSHVAEVEPEEDELTRMRDPAIVRMEEAEQRRRD